MGDGSVEKGASSLASAKPVPFALSLKVAIKDEFGTSKEFAKRLEVTEGRVSQILGGEVVSPYTLDYILRCFTSFANRKLLYDAWIATYAPNPLAAGDITVNQIEPLLAEANSFKAAGKAKQFVGVLESLLLRAPDLRLRFMILEESVNTALYLGRTSKAISLADTLFHSAQTVGDHGWIAKALYLKANASRTMNPKNPTYIVKCHEEAMSYARAFAGESIMCRLLAESLDRDRALTVVEISNGKSITAPILDDVLCRLDLGIERTEDIGNRLLWLEAKVRLLVTGGKAFDAEETLEQISSLRGVEPIDFSAKEQISRASLLIAGGQVEEAESILLGALDECLAVENLHHAGRVERLLSQILTARLL